MPTNRLIIKERIATYAQLLFQAAYNDSGSNGVLKVCRELNAIVKAMRGNVDLETVLKDPGYTSKQKEQVVRGVFADADLALVNTIIVMAERGEIDYLARVADQLESRMADELNLIILNVDSAVSLDDNLRNQIKKKVETELGKKAILNENVNKSLLGGIILSTKDERLDASLLTQVEKTREALKH